MKKAIIAMFALAATVACGARTTLDVQGVTYNVDTTFHAVVGPGTTQTSLKLTASANPLIVHYLIIDRTMPGVSIRAVCAKDMVAGGERTSAMAERKTGPGLDYFCGVNADFFATSGSATNGTSTVGTPTASCTVDGEIYKTSNSNYQFSTDWQGVPRVCRINYYTGTATLGSSVTLFKGVNVSSPNNGITVYTPRYWGTANQNSYAGSCYQVSAKLAEGSDPFIAGGKFVLEVTSEPTDDGDMTIPADGFVIHGRGTSKTGCNTGALSFVQALKPGDKVEFDNIILTPEGEAIKPYTVVSGNPKSVGGGLTLDTESERGDASARHPRTTIGYSEDGNKIIMMVVEGRGASVGVTTSMNADILRFAGAYEAVNLDGGGSSTLYTHALGVRNWCSDGNERAVGNAVFAVLEAPEDDEITTIGFQDWRITMPQYGQYTPKIMGYNKYGKVVNTDLTGFTLETEGGEVQPDGMTLIGGTPGLYALKAVYNGISTSVPLYIESGADGISPELTSVLMDNKRPWKVVLTATVEGKNMLIGNEVMEWSTSDAAVATVDAEGIVKGVGEGTCVISGKRDNINVAVNVTVEIAPKNVLPIQEDASVYVVETKTSMKSVELVPAGSGLTVNFTQSGTRGPKIAIVGKKVLYSLPEAIRLRFKTRDTPVTSFTVALEGNDGTHKDLVLTVPADVKDETELVFPVKDVLGLDEQKIFPVTFTRFSIVPKGSTNVPYTIEIPGIEALYGSESGVGNIVVDGKESGHASRWYTPAGIEVATPSAPGLYLNSDGRKVVVK